MRKHPTRLNGHYDEISSWDSPTGAQLCVYYKKAQATPKGIIHINHGLADHAGRYAHFAERLSAAGYHVYAQDHRGHGATLAPDSEQSVFAYKDGWEKTLQDMHFVNSQISNRHPNLPIILFGHSLGAMLGYNYLLRWSDTLHGAAIWNAAIVKTFEFSMLKTVLWVESFFKKPQDGSIISQLTFDKFNKSFKPSQSNSDFLSKDVNACKAYDDDPDCGWVASVSIWGDIANGINVGAADIGIEKIPKSMPIHLLGGTDDPATNFSKAVLLFSDRIKKRGMSNVKTVIRKGGRHEALNEPESERNAIMDDFIVWLDKSI